MARLRQAAKISTASRPPEPPERQQCNASTKCPVPAKQGPESPRGGQENDRSSHQQQEQQPSHRLDSRPSRPGSTDNLPSPLPYRVLKIPVFFTRAVFSADLKIRHNDVRAPNKFSRRAFSQPPKNLAIMMHVLPKSFPQPRFSSPPRNST